MVGARYDEMIHIPRAVKFPIEMVPPHGFDAERSETWPVVPGRLEWVAGRLWYMPPCGELQPAVVTDVVIALGHWVRQHRDFVLGSNEAGMRLGGATRAADAALWRRSDHRFGTGLATRPPLLAVEVSGAEEGEAQLLDKARWYLDVGVAVVWLVLSDQREILVVEATGVQRCRGPAPLPEHPALPGLRVAPAEFFVQVDAP